MTRKEKLRVHVMTKMNIKTDYNNKMYVDDHRTYVATFVPSAIAQEAQARRVS